MTVGDGILGDLRPFDPVFLVGDPHPIFEMLRRDDPVHRVEDGVWALLKHADIMDVSRNPEAFCSGKGVLPNDRTRAVSPDHSILFMDPPQHLRHRRLVSPGFHPRRLPPLEQPVRALVRRLLDDLDPNETVDFLDRVAAPFPAMVIAELLGIPKEDWGMFRVWSDALIAAANEFTDESLAKAAELYGYFREILAARRADPRDDLVSVLAHGVVDGEQLGEFELLGFCMTLLVAGNETTRNLISGGVVTLAEHPDQRARIVADPSLIGSAVDEMLRWWTPVMAFARTATRDVTIRGRDISEGDFVLLMYQSANRDEEVFGPTASTFDVTRAPNPHVAFGFGEHYCLGANLATLEARALFTELLARWPSYELAAQPIPRPSVLMHGLSSIPVRLAP
ncbi:MAG: cytochrome P450 [Actinomycetota bacterium]